MPYIAAIVLHQQVSSFVAAGHGYFLNSQIHFGFLLLVSFFMSDKYIIETKGKQPEELNTFLFPISSKVTWL